MSKISGFLLQIGRFFERSWLWLARPHASIDELGLRRRAQLMMAFSLIVALGMLGPVLLGRQDSFSRNLILWGLLLACLVSYLLGRTRLYKWGSLLLVFSLAGTGFALVLTGMANNSANALNTTLPLVLVIGSAILSLRGQVFLTLFCGFGPMLLPRITPNVTAADGMFREGGIFMVLGFLLVGVTVFRNRLESTRLQELRAVNQELQAFQETLEERVRERSSLAESARAEAEAARNAAETARLEVESHMWLAAGQAQLAEKIRGEQSLAQLTEKMLAQICQYLGAQAGAMYLLHGQALKFVAGYAFVTRENFQGEFQLGDGLVGQVALDRRPLLLNYPANTLILSTGLVDLSPSQVLLAPFELNGAVVGVFELATLTGFTPEQVNFLEQVSESIGVAVHTVQARERLFELLAETQRQAEELQAQEEELRAANEELQAQAEHLKAIRKTNVKR